MLAKSLAGLIKQSGKKESAAELAHVKYECLCVRECERDAEGLSSTFCWSLISKMLTHHQ